MTEQNQDSLNKATNDLISDRFHVVGKTTKLMYKSHRLDAGLDITSSQNVVIYPGKSEIINTSMVIAVPEGCVGLLWSRSGLSIKHNIEVGAGCIDSGYRGEVKVHLYNLGEQEYEIKVGDKIAQLLTIPVNLNNYVLVDNLDNDISDRGSNGFGSTGY